MWHEHEVTYAVAAPVAAFGSLAETYHAIHRRLAAALRALGVAAELAPARRARGALQAGACFAAPAGGEVLVDGRKVIGSAQVRHGRAFLQHGSILTDGSQDIFQAVSREPSADSQATTLRGVLGRPVSFDEVVSAIVGSWRGELAPSARPPVRLSVFLDPAWTWRR